MAKNDLPFAQSKPEADAKTATALVKSMPKFLTDLALRHGTSAEGFLQTVKATCLPGDANGEELSLFLMIAAQRELNPMTGEIYALKKKTGGIQPIIGKNGWNTLVNRSPLYDGRKFFYYHEGSDTRSEAPDPAQKLSMIECQLWRKDRTRPETAFAKMSEYYTQPMTREGKPYDGPWQKQTTTMLEHKAWNKAAAAAFGLADAVDLDEARQFCDLRSMPRAAEAEIINDGYDPQQMRNITPKPQPEAPSPASVAPGVRQEHSQGDKAASPKQINYLKGLWHSRTKELGVELTSHELDEFVAASYGKDCNLGKLGSNTISSLIEAWNTPEMIEAIREWMKVAQVFPVAPAKTAAPTPDEQKRMDLLAACLEHSKDEINAALAKLGTTEKIEKLDNADLTSLVRILEGE